MQKFETLEELRRHIAHSVGAVKIGKEVDMPYQTVSRFVRQYDPPVSRETEYMIAQGAYNATLGKIKELQDELEKYETFLPYIQEWIFDRE